MDYNSQSYFSPVVYAGSSETGIYTTTPPYDFELFNSWQISAENCSMMFVAPSECFGHSQLPPEGYGNPSTSYLHPSGNSHLTGTTISSQSFDSILTSLPFEKIYLLDVVSMNLIHYHRTCKEQQRYWLLSPITYFDSNR